MFSVADNPSATRRRQQLSQLSVIMFDLDDTLYPERDYISSGFRTVARKISSDPSVQSMLLETMHRLSMESRSSVFDRLKTVIEECAHSDGISMISRLGPGPSVEQMVRWYRGHKPDIEAFPEAVGVLSTLRDRGLRNVLITDGIVDVQRKKVEALGLLPYMDLVIYTDALGPGRQHWKPSPRAFQIALSHFGILPSQACYVGDNPSKDLTGPRTVGMQAVLIRRDGGIYRDVYTEGPEPDRTIEDLREVIKLLD